MQRRSYLALLGSGLAGTAGCLGREPTGDGGSASSPTGSPSRTRGSPTDPTTTGGPPTTTLDLGEPYEHPDGWSVTLSNARVRKIALRAGTHLDPVAFSGGQYVVVEVAVVGDANGPDTAGVLPDPAGFDVTLDGADAAPDEAGFWNGYPGTATDDVGTAAVPVATAESDQAAVRWQAPEEPVEWRLAADHREAIAREPAFEVREFAVPEVVEHGASFDASLTVANVGGRDDRFLAELGATTISDTPEFEFDVPAGESVGREVTVEPHYLEGTEELRVVLNWGVDRLVRTVAVE